MDSENDQLLLSKHLVSIYQVMKSSILSPSSDVFYVLVVSGVYIGICSCKWFFKVHIPLESFLALIFQWCNQLQQSFSFLSYKVDFFTIWNPLLHFSPRRKTSLTLKVSSVKKSLLLGFNWRMRKGIPPALNYFCEFIKKVWQLLTKRMRRKGVAAASSCSTVLF